MASLTENKRYYENYDWATAGEEWSEPWGGTRLMWLNSIYPRISQFLPASTIVEIGAGHGRIARILHAFATNRLFLFDIIDECVAVCNKEFADSAKTTCLLTEGKGLTGIADNSVDFIFSFYSLVGADADTIDGYLKEIDRVLNEDGVAFIHHSNTGMYYDPEKPDLDKRMVLLAAYRDISVDARSVSNMAHKYNLICIKQECINWDIKEVLSDCFSTIVRPESSWACEPQRVHNHEFQTERDLTKTKSRYYRRPRRSI